MQKTIKGIQLFGVALLSVALVALWIIHMVSMFLQTGSQAAMTYITNIYAQSFANEDQPERNGADRADQ